MQYFFIMFINANLHRVYAALLYFDAKGMAF